MKLKYRIEDAIWRAKAWGERVVNCHHNARVLVETEHRFSQVLDHATGGKMAGTSFDIETMRAYVDEYLDEVAEIETKELRETVEELTRDLDKAQRAIKTAFECGWRIVPTSLCATEAERKQGMDRDWMTFITNDLNPAPDLAQGTTFALVEADFFDYVMPLTKPELPGRRSAASLTDMELGWLMQKKTDEVKGMRDRGELMFLPHTGQWVVLAKPKDGGDRA